MIGTNVSLRFMVIEQGWMSNGTTLGARRNADSE